MFEVNERVRVRWDLDGNAAYGSNEEMHRLAGTIVTIFSRETNYGGRGTTYRIYEDGMAWSWGDSDLIKLGNEEDNPPVTPTRESIKEKWGKYCNTDKLINDMMALLTKYNHRNSEHGICKMLETFFTNKEALINLLEKSPNYKGDLRIIFKEEFERENSRNEIQRFVSCFKDEKGITECILSYKDKNGKAVSDYIATGVKTFSLKDIEKAKDVLDSAEIRQFNTRTGATVDSMEHHSHFINWMNYMYRVCTPTMPEDREEDGIKVAASMKTSRAFNRICTKYGVNKWSKYEKEFAKYADMVSGNKRTLYFIISVNPLDYLTMSFGNSWASCHTIDKTNRRRMPNSYSGQYCGGTVSYMLDSTSFITYCLDDIDGDLHEKGKIYRNMFHMSGQKFIQSRIYPQGNDGATDLYKKFREIVQREFVPIFGLENNKWKVRGVDSSDHCSYGVHYRDYDCFSSARVFYPTGYSETTEAIHIGHTGICAHCGRPISNSGSLAHPSCTI